MCMTLDECMVFGANGRRKDVSYGLYTIAALAGSEPFSGLSIVCWMDSCTGGFALVKQRGHACTKCNESRSLNMLAC